MPQTLCVSIHVFVDRIGPLVEQNIAKQFRVDIDICNTIRPRSKRKPYQKHTLQDCVIPIEMCVKRNRNERTIGTSTMNQNECHISKTTISMCPVRTRMRPCHVAQLHIDRVVARAPPPRLHLVLARGACVRGGGRGGGDHRRQALVLAARGTVRSKIRGRGGRGSGTGR